MPLSDQQKDYVDTICSSGELLVSLINDILDISKIESGKIELETIDFDLEYLIGSVLKILRQRTGTKELELNLTYLQACPENSRRPDSYPSNNNEYRRQCDQVHPAREYYHRR